MSISEFTVKELHPSPDGKILPCAKLAEQGNSSAPKLVLSSNFHHVRIQSAKPISCVSHKVTKGGLGLSRDQECSLVEKMKAEQGKVGREIRIHIPCGRRGMIDLSEVKDVWKIQIISNPYRYHQH